MECAVPIHSFHDRETERLFREGKARRIPPDIKQRASDRLLQLNRATALSDLNAFPGAKLEKLQRDRVGQYSIRVNDQWRICFRWVDGAHDVELVDYHRG